MPRALATRPLPHTPAPPRTCTHSVDGYTQVSGITPALTAADQLDYNRWLAATAHELGLGCGLKNDMNQVADLEPQVDFFVNE